MTDFLKYLMTLIFLYKLFDHYALAFYILYLVKTILKKKRLEDYLISKITIKLWLVRLCHWYKHKQIGQWKIIRESRNKFIYLSSIGFWQRCQGN